MRRQRERYIRTAPATVPIKMKKYLTSKTLLGGTLVAVLLIAAVAAAGCTSTTNSNFSQQYGAYMSYMGGSGSTPAVVTPFTATTDGQGHTVQSGVINWETTGSSNENVTFVMCANQSDAQQVYSQAVSSARGEGYQAYGSGVNDWSGVMQINGNYRCIYIQMATPSTSGSSYGSFLYLGINPTSGAINKKSCITNKTEGDYLGYGIDTALIT